MAKQSKGCDAKLKGLTRLKTAWQPVATLRRIQPCRWIDFFGRGESYVNTPFVYPDLKKRAIGIPRKQTQINKKVKYQP